MHVYVEVMCRRYVLVTMHCTERNRIIVRHKFKCIVILRFLSSTHGSLTKQCLQRTTDRVHTFSCGRNVQFRTCEGDALPQPLFYTLIQLILCFLLLSESLVGQKFASSSCSANNLIPTHQLAREIWVGLTLELLMRTEKLEGKSEIYKQDLFHISTF